MRYSDSQAKGISLEIDMRGNMPSGYTPYRYNFRENAYSVCKWYAFPFFKSIEKLKWYRICFYRWLNYRGIMNTPEHCLMQLSDIWRKEG